MNQIRSRNHSDEGAMAKPKRVWKINLWLNNAAEWLSLKFGLEERLTASFLVKILWLGLLAIIYIYFQHNFDKLIRKTDKAAEVVEQKRATYISYKAKYLYASKQSEIEKKLEGKGFTNGQSPVKISVKNP